MSTDGRCSWAGSDPLYLSYHDDEWGVPSHDDRHLFEMLILEGAQAGLSWETILGRRENYRRAFPGFAPNKVAKFDAAGANAGAFRERQREFGSFDAWVWRFVDGKPLRNQFRSLREIPPETAQ